MRAFLFLSILGPLLISTAAAAPLTVVTWNIEWLPGRHPDATDREKSDQMKAAQAVVKAINPDILMCQEIRDWPTAKELCSVVPGLNVYVVSNYGERPQNEIIASKLPLDSAWYEAWKPAFGPNKPPRGYAFAALRLASGALLLTFDTHLKSNLGGVEASTPLREEGARQLRAKLADVVALYSKRAPCDVLVGGDCNTSKDNPEFARDTSLDILAGRDLQSVFAGLPAASHLTIPASGQYPADTFDYLFYKGLKEDAVKVGDGTSASDHNPVVATMEF